MGILQGCSCSDTSFFAGGGWQSWAAWLTWNEGECWETGIVDV